MKKLFIKILCFILLLAMLCPLVVACDDDPPVNDDEGEGDGKYLSLKVKDTESFKLVDLANSAFLNKNSSIRDKVTTKDGIKVVPISETSVTFNMTEVKDLTYARSIRFSVYSDSATGEEVTLTFHNESGKQGGRWSIEHKFTVDFVGWKIFDFTQDEMSGYGPKNKTVEQFVVTVPNTDTEPDPKTSIYFSSVDVTKDIYEVQAPAGIDINDPAIYKAVTQNVRDSVIGTEYNWGASGYVNGLSGVNSACLSAWDEYKRTWKGINAPNTLFGYVIDRDNANASIWGNTAQKYITEHYKMVLSMAKGYATPGSAYYHNAELKTAIINCFEYGYKYYFGADFVEYGPYANWWNWQIGIPEYLHTALVLMEDALTPELCAKYLTGFDYLTPYPEGTGGNRIELARFCIISAALRQDAVDLCIAVEYMRELFGYIDSYTQEGGFFRDYSFIQHFSTPYTNGYGGYYMNNIPKMLYYISDTVFCNDDVNNLFVWVVEAFRPVMYKDRVMNAVAGRNVARIDRTENSRSYAANMVLMHYLAPEEYKKMLEPLIAEYYQIYGNIYSISCIAEYADALYAKLRDEYVAPYEVTKVFGMMSRVVHHGAKYGACLSISSKNITKFESFDGTNLVGWYQNDGLIQIYTDDYTFDKKFYSFANPYLMPGVTANSATRKQITHAPKNGSDYAGGISQGKYGSAGYINSYSGNADSFTSGVAHNVYAKKSYFFFDNEIVCVGSGISDSSGTEVKTTVDNRYWRSGDVLSASGNAVSPSSVNTLINSRALHFTNMGGYVVLDSNSIYYCKATHGYNGTINYTEEKDIPTGTYDFLELYISHGTNATSSNKYFYAYLPTATVAETQSYYANPDVLLLKQTANTHAVLEKNLGIVAANFFEATSDTVTVDTGYSLYTAVKSIKATAPACVMVTKGENGEYLISVSDPTNSYSSTSITVQIAGVTSVVSSDDGVSATVSGGVVSITANTADSLRQTFTLTVK